MQVRADRWGALGAGDSSYEITAAIIIWLAVLHWSTHATSRIFHTGEASAVVMVAVGGVLLLLGAALTREAARSVTRMSNWLLRSALHAAVADETSESPAPLALSPRTTAVSARERSIRVRVPVLEPNAPREYFEMDPRQFEDAVAQLFQHNGFRVEQMPFVNDGGKDAIAWRDGFKYLVECKRYERSQAVHRRDMQILAAAMQDERAHGGYYVTTGRFTRPAIEYATLHHIELVDGDVLTRIVAQSGCAKGC